LILPRDEKIKKSISACEQKLRSVSAVSSPVSESDSGIVTDGKSDASKSLFGTAFREWDFPSLHPDDYAVEGGSLIFRPTSRVKTALAGQLIKDADVETLAENLTPGVVGKYGICFREFTDGQTLSDASFLEIVNEKRELAVLKRSGNDVQILLSVQLESMGSDLRPVRLKLKILGPYLIAYVNERPAGQWEQPALISGRAGLYADPGLNIKFSEFFIRRMIQHDGK
jgi:hypothetical protein